MPETVSHQAQKYDLKLSIMGIRFWAQVSDEEGSRWMAGGCKERKKKMTNYEED